MNEQSITSLGTTGLRSLPEKIIRGFRRLVGRGDGTNTGQAPDHKPPAPPASSEVRARAADGIREYAEHNEALFERASRFSEKAERLQDSDGTTSESALNRAERARREIRAGLSALRESFVASEGEEGVRVFDAELEARYPELGASEETAG